MTCRDWRLGTAMQGCSVGWRQTVLLVLLVVFQSAGVVAEDRLPAVRVDNVRRVFHDGQHNAFTDLIRFQNRFYLTFRSCPDGHMVHPTSSIIVLVSDDCADWQQVYQFSVARRDVRDPHFLVFQDRLFVYTGTWFCGDSSPKNRDLNQHLGYCVWTGDGQEWSQPTMLEGTYGHYIWRAATYGGKAYLCGRRKREFSDAAGSNRAMIQSAMLESDDGLVWRTASMFQETWGDETAFVFEPDGAVLAVSRRGSEAAEVCRSAFPYQGWDRRPLDRYIGGPLLVRWGDRYLVGGRNQTPDGPRTTLCWLTDVNTLTKVAQLPSDGDNSYPGFIALNQQQAVVSWYSSHESDSQGQPLTAIYMADLLIEDDPK